MKFPRRKFLHLAVSTAALPAISSFAWSQAYPSKPLRWIVGFPPGGGADTVARIMGQWLSERLWQPVILENRPGAGTNIAVLAVVNSPPDGYTLLFLGASAIVNTSMYENLPSIYTAILHPLRSDRFSHGDGCASISPCENGRRVH